ncbi:hypothetical protein AMJ57_01220 [Parcubacteria bacterium SG8_24]|nr:MAG: hypothetical protein AMJ57_01220 [Parcubacteria bacterium SG8_24]
MGQGKGAEQRHPHAFTLELMRLAIEKLPPSFNHGAKKKFERAYHNFVTNPSVPYQHIHETITRLGKESWPHRKAYHEMYETYGRSSEESFLLKNLDEGIRDKYERFIHEGGKISYFEGVRPAEELQRPSPFERYFTPEEKFAIEQALLAARDSAREEIDSLVTGKKREEFDDLFRKYKNMQMSMDGKIAELRGMVGLSEKWAPTILDRIRTFEEGWSVVERGLEEEELDQELEYWRGTLENFLRT